MHHIKVKHHSPARYSDALLTDFARVIGAMDRPTLLKLRAECIANMPEPDPDDVFLEIIDGNLGLRAIAELED